MIERIKPEDEKHWLQLRVQDVTSTESPALFGLSPYMTEFELWHRKKEQTIVTLEENDRMKWGTRLQDAIAQGIAHDKDWELRKMTEYIRHGNLRLGSSFDFAVVEDGKDVALLEIKNVDSLAFRDGWIIDGNDIEAPPHIEIQVQHQLAVTGLKVAYIGALIGGNKVVLIKREADEKILSSIRSKVRQFWISIDENKQPKPDFEKDAEFIASLYQYAEPGKLLDANGNDDIRALAETYREMGEMEKKAKSAKDAVKAQLLMKIGNSEKVLGDLFTISAGMIGPCHMNYERAGYRNFKVNWKKVKS